jgi:5-methylcytosine-specific restriction endonuclease McrA
MPIDYKKYPSNWKSEIRPNILKRAKNCCEKCGLKNYTYGFRDLSGKFYSTHYILNRFEITGLDFFDDILSHHIDKIGKVKAPIKIVLTIAHLDHDISNNCPTNLKALCQKCHLSHDAEHHKKNAQQTIKTKKGLLELQF